MIDRIVVLSSGGLDSAICLTIVLDQSFDCFALSFYYGQRSVSELAAERLVDTRGSRRTGRIGSHRQDLAVPECGTEGIPVTYVPARNTVFLSYALA